MTRFTDVLIDHDAGEPGWLSESADDPPGPRWEVCLSFPGTAAEARAKAQAEIAAHAAGQVEHTVGIDVPAGDPVPGVDWREGDLIGVDGTDLTCVAITSGLDDDTGRWSDVPQFGVLLDGAGARNARAIRNIGSVGSGGSRLSRPNFSAAGPDVRPAAGGACTCAGFRISADGLFVNGSPSSTIGLDGETNRSGFVIWDPGNLEELAEEWSLAADDTRVVGGPAQAYVVGFELQLTADGGSDPVMVTARPLGFPGAQSSYPPVGFPLVAGGAGLNMLTHSPGGQYFGLQIDLSALSAATRSFSLGYAEMWAASLCDCGTFTQGSG